MGDVASRRASFKLAASAGARAAEPDSATAVRTMARVTRVEPLQPYWLRLWFADGSIHEVDVEVALEGGGVFREVYANPELFAKVRVEERFGTVEWPGSVDLDPEVLRGDHEPEGGRPYPRRIVRGPHTNQPA